MLDNIRQLLESDNLTDWLLSTSINIVLALLIFIVGSWIVGRLVLMIEKLLQSRGIDHALGSFVRAVLSTVLKFAVIIIALEQVGLDTTSLLALLGAAGLAVGLALKDSLSNFASGVMLILLKPMKIFQFLSLIKMDNQLKTFLLSLKSPQHRKDLV